MLIAYAHSPQTAEPDSLLNRVTRAEGTKSLFSCTPISPPTMSTEIVREQLIQAAKQGNFPFDSKQFADYMDANDELSKYKAEFAIPLRRNVSGENPIAGKLFWLRARAREV